MMLSYNGIPVFVSQYAETRKKVPIRPHRKKRIAKKWAKRYGYKCVGTPGAFIQNTPTGKVLYCTPEVWDALQKYSEAPHG